MGDTERKLMQSSGDTARSLRETLKVLEKERAGSEDLRNKVAGLAGLILATAQANGGKVTTRQQLGAMCSNDLPAIIGCKSAALLLYNARGAEAGSFTAMLDKKDNEVNTLDSAQVNQIPLFSPSARGRFQSKILLMTGPDKPPFGILLCFEPAP